MRTQYAVFSHCIDRVFSDPECSFYLLHLWDIPSIWHDPLSLKPNASRRLFAEKLRVLSKNMELPVLQRTDLRLEALQGGPIRRWIPRPNAVGRSAVGFHLVALEKSIESASDRDLTQAFTAALVACKCWEARHGALPPSLDALVPEYLDAVPRDPYDGKPLRYSAEKKIVYSVGMDGKDSGGLADPDTDDACVYRAEPTLRIEP